MTFMLGITDELLIRFQLLLSEVLLVNPIQVSAQVAAALTTKWATDQSAIRANFHA